MATWIADYGQKLDKKSVQVRGSEPSEHLNLVGGSGNEDEESGVMFFH